MSIGSLPVNAKYPYFPFLFIPYHHPSCPPPFFCPVCSSHASPRCEGKRERREQSSIPVAGFFCVIFPRLMKAEGGPPTLSLAIVRR